jgi:hypothetical protein
LPVPDMQGGQAVRKVACPPFCPAFPAVAGRFNSQDALGGHPRVGGALGSDQVKFSYS